MLAELANAFAALRWIGVALSHLPRPQSLAPAGSRPDTGEASASLGPPIYLHGFLVSLTNPKTLLFYGAFLPQFASPGADLTGQLVLLSEPSSRSRS